MFRVATDGGSWGSSDRAEFTIVLLLLLLLWLFTFVLTITHILFFDVVSFLYPTHRFGVFYTIISGHVLLNSLNI